MAEYYTATIVIFDWPETPPAAVLEAFERLREEGTESLIGDEGIYVYRDANGRRCAHYDNSLRDADEAFDEYGVTQALRDHALAYEITVAQDWGVNMIERYWQPGMDAEEARPINGDGEPVITATTLSEITDAHGDPGRTLAELQRRLAPRVPPNPGEEAAG